MPNRVELKNNIIYTIYIGDQTESTVRGMSPLVDPLIHDLRNRNLPVNFVVDLAQMGGQNLATRAAAAQMLRQMDFDRIAIINASPVLKHATMAVIGAIRQSHKMRVFKTEAEALVWLKS